ncbi:acyl-CoA dehydrogenase family protein [Bordetella genomosp. 2]|uniref:Acyl-CoA dehydrogenase n=1 Tax=Bordetella genomosp. 2 TaxID=1983456 RepID=A0A261VQT1_9BORD|nr:acyl-CoA dehydrogenase family protein [Bordetella genomosp. 2]OZI76478.1 acyl-CoA dehydrogenase [Bordetella genomosp. 2]
MELDALQDDEAFRLGLREWLAAAYAGFVAGWPGRADPASLDFRQAWEDALCAAGWAGLGWPREYGGRALPLRRQAIFHEEHARCGAPLGVNLIGHGILAPTLLHFGTEEQKRRFLPGILSNREVWCQGYSEPGAGSDLAAVRTRAEPGAGGYVLNGHKIWTSFADRAHWCFVLARTDPQAPRHRGLSFLLVDMRDPGVRVEPIRQLTGEAEFCEVFFEQVRVPAECRLGEENQGWRIAMAAASFERGTYFIPRLVRFAQELQQVRALALRTDAAGNRPADDVALRRRWARLSADSHVLALKSQRALQAALRGDPPGPEGSSTKVHWSEAHQRLLGLAMDILGPRAGLAQAGGDAQDAGLVRTYLWSRAETILAGTSEIQRNIIAEQVLGLPKG